MSQKETLRSVEVPLPPEIQVPKGGFSGTFLMESIARAMQIQQLEQARRNDIYAAEHAISDRLRDPETRQLLYADVEDMPPQLLSELGQMSLAAHILEAQPIASRDLNAPSLSRLITEKYVGRKAHIEQLAGAIFKPIQLANTGSYMPKLRQKVDGKISIMSAIGSAGYLEIDRRFGNRYSVQTHSQRDVEPLVEINMLDEL